jgi:hypothetical protein
MPRATGAFSPAMRGACLLLVIRYGIRCAFDKEIGEEEISVQTLSHTALSFRTLELPIVGQYLVLRFRVSSVKRRTRVQSTNNAFVGVWAFCVTKPSNHVILQKQVLPRRPHRSFLPLVNSGL